MNPNIMLRVNPLECSPNLKTPIPLHIAGEKKIKRKPHIHSLNRGFESGDSFFLCVHESTLLYNTSILQLIISIIHIIHTSSFDLTQDLGLLHT